MFTPLSKYPTCLINELAKYGQKPTGNLEYDRAVLQVMQKRSREASYDEMITIESKLKESQKERINALMAYPNLADPDVFRRHANLFIRIANEVVLLTQHRRFVIDDYNCNVIRFLLYYFNNCALAEDVFPGRGYKLHKNIMLKGGLGVGKSLMMQCFSEYLRQIGSPRFFLNYSVTQMVNYYTLHNSINAYIFNEDSRGVPHPVNICLNDIGLDDDKVFFGTRTAMLTDEFLYARNDIWSAYDKFGHVTTNLDEEKLIKRFNSKDSYGRIVDRFKTYNVIELLGESRR